MLLSGGRCELCQEQIVFPYQSTNGQTKQDSAYNYTCEIAHIFGLNSGSARYDKDKDAEILNEPDNLLVVCPSCHKLIDKQGINQKYTAESLIAKKESFENGTIQSIMTMGNKTNIGGHVDYKSGQKLLKFFAEDNDSLTGLKSLDELESAADADFELLSRQLILSLNNLNIDSRTALLTISKLCSDQSDYKTTYTYWDSAYGDKIKQVLGPLSLNNYINTSAWEYDGNDAKLEIVTEWSEVIRFLTQNKIPLEQLIIQRNYTVFDE